MTDDVTDAPNRFRKSSTHPSTRCSGALAPAVITTVSSPENQSLFARSIQGAGWDCIILGQQFHARCQAAAR
jgi:hypothetical protein